MKSSIKVLAAVAAASSLLGGCAVYQPAPVYSQAPVYSAPVMVQPAPVYAAPPVSFSFGYWGGRGWGHRH
ncbi:hypothetical protein SAMN06265795_1039 [Noviherbaspirillum humi]|uniref:PXPV repeat-containing protein n=1 Tax=Noviherbaspirillum humi TaxID=1688639 RepID=A0A239EVJ3_9BURK|nr:hypothetical protein [Noviherbaspirillum humi]SNS47922.1 hypothetical protein SAMN06265795_1039 [Noviherbaspirillum humi]